MNSPIFVKLGGSALTDKNAPEALAPATLHAVAATLAAHQRHDPAAPLLIGHGGGSFGHHWASRYGTAAGITGPASWEGVVRVADAMARLNRAVVEALLQAGLPAIGVQPMASALAAAGALTAIGAAQLAALLAGGVVPVIYGDVIIDTVQGCTIASTETIFAALVPSLRPARLILVGEEAVYDADPRRHPKGPRAAQPIPLIDAGNYAAVLDKLGGSHGVDVTGGMRAKVEAMWALAATAPDLEIAICGPAALGAALRNEPLPQGTVIRGR